MRKNTLTKKQFLNKKNVICGRIMYAVFITLTIIALFSQPVYATTIWDKANEIMKDVYSQILLISTIAAIVTKISTT